MVVVNTENFSGLLPAMTPATVYSQLAARGLRLNFDGRGAIRVSGRLPSQLLASDFVGEGSPIPANKLNLVAQSVGPAEKTGGAVQLLRGNASIISSD